MFTTNETRVITANASACCYISSLLKELNAPLIPDGSDFTSYICEPSQTTQGLVDFHIPNVEVEANGLKMSDLQNGFYYCVHNISDHVKIFPAKLLSETIGEKSTYSRTLFSKERISDTILKSKKLQYVGWLCYK